MLLKYQPFHDGKHTHVLILDASGTRVPHFFETWEVFEQREQHGFFTQKMVGVI